MHISVTVDVESDWGGITDEYFGLVCGLPYILELFESLGLKATFFISGVVAAKYAKVIRRISEAGHELASHGFTHADHSAINKQQLFEDIKTSKQLLEDETGTRILGFRAPRFRIVAILRPHLTPKGIPGTPSYLCSRTWLFLGRPGGDVTIHISGVGGRRQDTNAAPAALPLPVYDRRDDERQNGSSHVTEGGGA